MLNPEPEEVPKLWSKGVPAPETERMSKPQPEEVPKPQPENVPKSEGKSNSERKEYQKPRFTEVPKPEPEEVPKPEPEEVPKTEPEEVPKTELEEVLKPEPEEERKEVPKPEPEEVPKPERKEVPNPQPKSEGSWHYTNEEYSCGICRKVMDDPVCLPKCGHKFCGECIMQSFKVKQACPVAECQMMYGVITGDQSDGGKMQMSRGPAMLKGFERDTPTLIIEYTFPRGDVGQTNAGGRCKEMKQKAYLPNKREGRKVLMLLKTAFDRNLIFTADKSPAAGGTCIVWNDIEHKTETKGSAGYPDATYLTRVQEELAAKGVKEDDLTGMQKKFIQWPATFYPTPFEDFSHRFNVCGGRNDNQSLFEFI